MRLGTVVYDKVSHARVIARTFRTVHEVGRPYQIDAWGLRIEGRHSHYDLHQ